MPQPPFLIDQIQIEPGSGDTLTLTRDAATGALRFQDAVTTGGVLLHQLAGLRSIGNVFVVGKSGVGAEYNTIQAAMDAVPAGASASNPYVILVLPGRYDETVNIVRDGVHLIGIGQPELRSALEATPNAAGNDHTLIISAQLGTTPDFCLIQGFKISNAHDNKACVRIVGGAGSTVLQSKGLLLKDCELYCDSPGGNYSVWGSTAGRITAENCVLSGTSALSSLLLQEMSLTQWKHCSIFNSIQFRYDTGQDQPAGGVGNVFFLNCLEMTALTALSPAISIDNDGSGSSRFEGCTVSAVPLVQYSGDQTHYVWHSFLGQLSLQETVTVEMVRSAYDSVLAPNANAVLDEDVRRGTVTLAAATDGAVTFDIPFSDDNYAVSLELPSRPVNDETAWITLKAGTGFTVNFNTAQTMTIEWVATRR